MDFYQGDPSAEPQCVLTDEVEHIQIHHLNEQPADSDRVSNLVPLARRLNQAIERRRVRSWPAELTFDRIRDRSGSCYALGRYAQSYGGSMIGLTLAWNVPAACEPARGYSQRPDAAALFCANALVSLRPLNRVDHAATLLALYVVPILRDRGLGVERHTCARLAMEIGSYFRDAGEYSRARRCVAVARRSLSRERNTERNQTLLARLWQHDGITALAEGNGYTASECFKRASQFTTADYSIGFANDHLYHVHTLLRAKRPLIEEAQQLVAKYHQRTDPMFITKWTELELRLAEAQSYYLRRDASGKRQAFDIASAALTRLTRERIVPTGTMFPEVLRAFADEYRAERIQVQALARTLTPAFRGPALRAAESLRKLALA